MRVLPNPPPTTRFATITSSLEDGPKVGELLILEYNVGKERYKVLGIVSDVSLENPYNVDTLDPKSASRISPKEVYNSSRVYLIGRLTDDPKRPIIPLLYPPIPGVTEVRRAVRNDLKGIIEPREDDKYAYIDIGRLTSINERVYVSLEEIASKHLAVLAITGAGKSNTVAHIVRSIVSDDSRTMPVFIFDIHGEYNIAHGRFKLVAPKIDLQQLSPEEVFPLINIPEEAYIERYIFSEVLESTQQLAELLGKYGGKEVSPKNYLALLTGVLFGVAYYVIKQLSKSNMEKKLASLTTLIARQYNRMKNVDPVRANYFIFGYLVTKYKFGGFPMLGKIGDRITIEEIDEQPLPEYVDYSLDKVLITGTSDEAKLNDVLQNIHSKYYMPAIITAEPSRDLPRVYNLIRKLNSFVKDYDEIIDYPESPSKMIEDVFNSGISKAYVIDLSKFNIEKADVIVGIYLREIFNYSKDYTLNNEPRVNALIVMEEAHNFIGESRNGFAKASAERIMREGRKYGVGMIIVSQRPRKLDTNIMSQVNNYVILKIVHPDDQVYVSELTESMPQELSKSLANLDVGEALLIGSFIKLPLMVKIHKVEEKRIGSQPKIVHGGKKNLDIDIEFTRDQTHQHVFQLIL